MPDLKSNTKFCPKPKKHGRTLLDNGSCYLTSKPRPRIAVKIQAFRNKDERGASTENELLNHLVTFAKVVETLEKVEADAQTGTHVRSKICQIFRLAMTESDGLLGELG